jgi:hypothetical protein
MCRSCYFPLWTLGSQFIDPINELGIGAALTNEAEEDIAAIPATLLTGHPQYVELADEIAEDDCAFAGHGGISQKAWRQPTRQADPPRVLRARCNLSTSILTLVHVVVANWSLGRPLKVPVRDQTCSSSGATTAATFILLLVKRRSRRYEGSNQLRVAFGRGSSHFDFCHLNRCSRSLVRLGGLS